MAARELIPSTPRCSTGHARASSPSPLLPWWTERLPDCCGNNVYTLAAKAGDNFLLRLLDPTPPRSSGRASISTTVPAHNCFFSTQTIWTRRNFTVPADGTYSLVVTDSYDNTQSGPYSFSLLRLNQPLNAVPLNCGAPAAGQFPALSLGRRLQLHAAAGRILHRAHAAWQRKSAAFD